MNNLDNWYLYKDEPNSSCLLALRDIIVEQDEHVSEPLKYAAPCFSYLKKMFCYLMVDKKTNWPYMLFVEGRHLNYPELEAGNCKRMKTLSINPNEDLPVNTIVFLLNEALDIYRKGIIKIK